MEEEDFFDLDAELDEEAEEHNNEEEEAAKKEEEEEEEEPEKPEEEETLEGNVLDEATLTKNLKILDAPGQLEYSYSKLMMPESELKDASILANFPHLRFISLEGNTLRKIPWIGQMKEAVFIDLHGNGARALPQFPEPFPNLLKCNLSENAFRFVPILPFPTLTLIDLSNNRIKEVEPGAFSQLVSLETLRLNNNKFRRITADTFKGLHNLKNLQIRMVSYLAGWKMHGMI